MSNGKKDDPLATTLRLRRTFQAPRERVYKAWTEPAQLERWFAPTDRHVVRVLELELRPGGRYRFEMDPRPGEVFRLSGVFEVVKPPERLVYTWRWGGWGDEEPDSRVGVEFHARGEATEVVLTHERLVGPGKVEKHTEGWSGCLDRLDRWLADRPRG